MTEPTAVDSAARQSRAQLISAVGRRIREPHMSPGSLASLRRGSRSEVVRQAAFYAALADVPDDQLSPRMIVRWAAVAQCIALTGVAGKADGSDGRILASCRLSESRFARLLASHGHGLFDQLTLVARLLRSRDARPSWSDLGELALSDEINEIRADAVRLRLARDFYRALTSQSET